MAKLIAYKDVQHKLFAYGSVQNFYEHKATMEADGWTLKVVDGNEAEYEKIIDSDDLK